MKILMVNTEYTRGGAARIARTLQQAVNSLPNHESLFVYGRGPKKRYPTAVRFTCQPEVYLHAILTRATGIQGHGSWASTRRLLRLIRQWKPDILHFHNIHGYYLNLGIARAIGKLGMPAVWTLHDAWPLTGRCAYFFDCERWRTGCGRCPYPREYPRTYFDTSRMMWRKKRELFGGLWNPLIVTPSQWLANLVLEACGRRCRVEVIPNGNDTQVFRPRDRWQAREESGLPKDKRIVLFAAADLKDERKGTRYFFECLNYVEEKEWMVVTVGKTAAIPRALKSRPDIKQLGYLKESESMARAYSAADLFCITSLDDNFPTTVLESMSCGTPVVGFSVGGVPEQVTEGCGQLVPPRDAKALGRAITAVLEDEELRHAMGERCREKAVREYDQKPFVERHLALYNELVEGGALWRGR